MQWNSVKKKLKEGGKVTNGWLHIPSSWTAEVMANAGWDSITVDTQHGLIDLQTALGMIQSIQTTDTIPMARATWNDPGSIMKLLDMGYAGIICPMINTAEECEQFVQACRYPPDGIRSFGPTRAKVVYGNDYGHQANDQVLTLAMIETVEAIENLEDIVNVEGLDGVFVGTRDLQLSMSASGIEDVKNEFDLSMANLIDVLSKHQKIPGIWCPAVEAAKIAYKSGFRFVAVLSDNMILTEHAEKLVNELSRSK